MQSEWVAAELQTANFGDRRLQRRLVRLVTDLAARPESSVRQACGTWAATKGAYRFWDSPRVTPELIRQAHQDATLQRIGAADSVLVLQDTTDLDYTGHAATTGLGPLAQPQLQGLKVHSSLAVSLAGVPLGLVAQSVWTREAADVGQARHRRQRKTANKESQRWLTALTLSQTAIPTTTRVITVADREADIYALFTQPRRLRSELLIRATHDRRVLTAEEDEAHYLWATVRAAPVAGSLTLTVPRRPQPPPRRR